MDVQVELSGSSNFNGEMDVDEKKMDVEESNNNEKNNEWYSESKLESDDGDDAN